MVLSILSYASPLSDVSVLKTMDHQLNQHPWNTYQSLLKEKPRYEMMSSEYKLWWLYRKAQAENLLFLLERFEQTVESAKPLLSATISNDLFSHFLIFQGIVNQRQGRYQAAKLFLSQALSKARKNNFPRIAVQAKQELAYTRSLIDLFETSLYELQQAYVDAFALSDDYLIAKINEVYGAIYGYMGDYEKSIEYYQKALTRYKILAYPSDIAEALNGIAATYRYWKKYDLAINYYHRYEKAIKFSPENIDGKFYAAYGIAMSEAEKGICQQALLSIDDALALEGLIDYKAELYKRKAQCLLTLKKIPEAEQAIKKADDIFAQFSELKGTNWQLETIKIHAEISKAAGNSDLAYQLLKKYQDKKITFIIKQASERLSRVRGELEQERQKVESSLFQQRTRVEQLQKIQQQQVNTIKNYVIVFMLFIMFSVFVFVVIQRRYHKKLLALSIKDPLSGLFNRRYVFRLLSKLITSINTQKDFVSIMMIDIDNFKQINDQYGHPFGDYVIQEIAKIGQETLRVDDAMGRIGGEEFLCALPRIDVNQALLIANRFVKNVSQHSFKLKKKNGHDEIVAVTISVGISATSKEGKDALLLYNEADKALYQAKAKGKNCAVKYQDYMLQSHQINEHES